MDSASATRKRIIVTETTLLERTERGPTSAGPTGYAVEHEVILEKSSGSWLISSWRSLGDARDRPPTDIDPYTPISALGLAQIEESRRPPTMAPRSESSIAAYNYAAMISYATRWWNSKNSAYPTNYEDDCTNFVSQCMRAGGWAYVGSYPADSRTDNRKWWKGDYAQTSSYSWGASQNFKTFAGNSGRVQFTGILSNLGYADVLGYDWSPHNSVLDHVQICTQSGGSSPLMTQHSGNYVNKPLSEILAVPKNASASKIVLKT